MKLSTLTFTTDTFKIKVIFWCSTDMIFLPTATKSLHFFWRITDNENRNDFSQFYR